MINRVYQLIRPKFISVKYDTLDFDDTTKVLIRPKYIALCHADQRYYQGQREMEVLKKKLPMALIHEAVGEVVNDPKGIFEIGEMVALIPNQPLEKRDGVYENYTKGYFRSSGHDGFMREYVSLDHDRVVSIKGADEKVASITEFISVAVHASSRFINSTNLNKDVIGIWGDGSLSYILASVLKKRLPDSKVIVVGKDRQKLNLFTFVDETYDASELGESFRVDHAFECCGGSGSFFAIDDIIKYINPQGSVMLMGVTENKVAINTRDILEKGLTFVGCSRSGREDFKLAVEFLLDDKFTSRLRRVVYESETIRRVDDIHDFFATDKTTSFKTIAKWEI